MTKHRTFSLEEIEEAAELQCGFCVACGAMRKACEPDARHYQCDECGRHQVFGVDELYFTGRVR
jgi:hypothetical protein